MNYRLTNATTERQKATQEMSLQHQSAGKRRHLGRIRTETWGLSLCPPQIGCAVCQMYGEDKTKLKYLRDLFVERVPGWLISKAYDIPLRQGRNYHILRHAWRQGWYHRRNPYIIPTKRIVELAILARLRQSWHLYSKDTPDKMVKLLAQLEMAEQKKAAS